MINRKSRDGNNPSSSEYRGKLFFPDTDTQTDAVLDLEQCLLSGIGELDPEGKETWTILHGEFEGLGKVTFLECFQVLCLSSTGRFTGAMQFVKLVAGRHLPDPGHAFISSITLWSAALNEWFCADLSLLEKHLVSPHAVPLVELETGNLRITAAWNGDFGSYNEQSVPVTELTMRFLKPVSISEFGVLHHQLRNLILFLTNEDPTLQFEYCNDTELFILRKSQEFDRDWFTNAVEFSYAEIARELETIFRNWFEHPKLDNIRDLLLERKYNKDLFKERYFLSMCVALESFHRRFIKKNVALDDQSPVEKRAQIKQHLAEDPGLQKWFLEKSSHWEKPTLFDRLIDLKDDYSKVVQGRFKMPVEELIRKVKKCRDHLAHDGEYTMVFRDEQELFLVGYSLEMLLSVLLYKFHGITEDEPVRKLYAYTHWNLERLCEKNKYEGI